MTMVFMETTMRLAGLRTMVFMVMSIAVGGGNNWGVCGDNSAVGRGKDKDEYRNDS